MRKSFAIFKYKAAALTVFCLVCFSLGEENLQQRFQFQPSYATQIEVQTDNFKMNMWRDPEMKLRGANIWQRLVTTKDGGSMGPGYIGPPYDSERDFQKLKDWGANYIHISHPGIFFEKPTKDKYEVDERSLTNLRSLVEACRAKGIYVVIAFRTGPERNEERVFSKNKQSDLWNNDLAQQSWEEMWKKTASEFRNYSNVVGYDLMVEPELKADDIESPKAIENAHKWNLFANRMITAIRNEDQETPILIGGIGMSDVNGLQLLDTNIIDPRHDRKIVYTVHQYSPNDYAQQTEGKWNFNCQTKANLNGVPKPKQYKSYQDFENNPKFRNETLPIIYQRIRDWRTTHTTADYQPPLAVTEFGVIRWAGKTATQHDAKDYLAKEFSEINNLKLNYAIWKWDASFCTGDDDYNFRHGEVFENHDELDDNPLTTLIRNQWQRPVIEENSLKR